MANKSKKPVILYSKLYPDGTVRMSENANTAVRSASRILGTIPVAKNSKQRKV